MKPIRRVAPTHCQYCNSNSIDIFDQYDHAIGYNQILQKYNTKKEIIDELNTFHGLSYMGCRKCLAKFMIDWTGDLPRPLRDQRIINNINMGKFK